MKNKNNFIIGLIYSIFITMFLIYLFIKTTNGKIILIPFLICSFATLGKNASLAMNKQNYVNIFNKIFILGFLSFFFGFLFYWCYTTIISKDYTLLLFSIPFWICGIFLIKKFLFKTKNKNSKIKTKYNFKIIISIFLVIVSLLSGIIMLFFGIKDTYILNKNTKNYITTNGYFNNYDIYNSDEDGTTYKLTYTYEVNNVHYSITTDYGTNYIPDKNSVREVKYNPNNPQEAILVGTNNKNGLIFMGAFFTLGTIAFILGALSVLGYFKKFKIDIVGTYIGFLILIIGIGVIALQNGTTMSILETIKSFGLWLLIPIMFIVVGILQIIKCIFPKNINKSKNY